MAIEKTKFHRGFEISVVIQENKNDSFVRVMITPESAAEGAGSSRICQWHIDHTVASTDKAFEIAFAKAESDINRWLGGSEVGNG